MSVRTSFSGLARTVGNVNVRCRARFHNGCHSPHAQSNAATTSVCLHDVQSSGVQSHTIRKHNDPIYRQGRRYISSAVATAPIASTKPFSEMPITGGYDGGIMGVVAPAFHAWRGKAFTKPHEYLRNCHKELGPIFRSPSVQSALGWNVDICNPDEIEKVFRAVGRYPNRPLIESWNTYRDKRHLSRGLLTSENETWHRLRTAVSKGILKPTAMVSHVESMHEVVFDFIDKVRTVRRQDGIVPDIETELYKWAMESSATFLFDKRLGLVTQEVLRTENQEFFDALHTLTLEAPKLYRYPPIVLNNLPERYNPAVKNDHAWDSLFALTETYVDAKLDALVKISERGEDINDGTFVAYLMLQDKLSRDEIYANVAEIMPASVDTTSLTSAWMIHEISKKPEVQDKLYDELMRISPEEGVLFNSNKLDSMTYLKATVKEVQRLYPITIGTARILDEDIILHGYEIPKGTQISTNFYAACRDPKVFDKPLEFRPERWFQTSMKYHPFASMPFGHGTRMCVGRRLAQQEMYLLLIELIRHFRIEPTKPNVGSNCGVTINPESSIEPRFIERNPMWQERYRN